MGSWQTELSPGHVLQQRFLKRKKNWQESYWGGHPKGEKLIQVPGPVATGVSLWESCRGTGWGCWSCLLSELPLGLLVPSVNYIFLTRHCLPHLSYNEFTTPFSQPPKWLANWEQTVFPWSYSAIFGFILPLPCSKAMLALLPFTLKVNSPLLGFQRSSSKIHPTLFKHISLTTSGWPVSREHTLPVVASGSSCMWYLPSSNSA